MHILHRTLQYRERKYQGRLNYKATKAMAWAPTKAINDFAPKKLEKQTSCLIRECKLGHQNLVFGDLFCTWLSLFQQEINLVKALLVGELLAQNNLKNLNYRKLGNLILNIFMLENHHRDNLVDLFPISANLLNSTNCPH